MSLDNNELLQAEAQRRLTGPLKREGDALRWLVEAKPADLLNVAETLRREAHDFISKKKKELFELDKGEIPRLLRKAGIRSSPAELVAQIEAAGPPRVGDWTVERTASLSNGAWSPDQIVADPVRFRATHVTSHLVWRLFLANCADPQVETSPKEKQVLGWWRTKSEGKGGLGVWYDTFIAGEAAYMNQLVSNDGNQRCRCEFLRKRGLLSFDSMSLSEFVR